MLTAFDRIERTDTTPKQRSEEIFAYWNRSPRPVRERLLIEKWFAAVLPNEQKELYARLRAGNEQVGSVVQELCLRALLRHQGCQVHAHPSSNGKNTRPDYEVTQPDGSVFIVEARTSTTIPTGPVNEQRRNRIVDRLRRFRLDGLATIVAKITIRARLERMAAL